MVDVNVEFARGILFVRLNGILNKSNECEVQQKIYEIVKEGGIRFLVFNTQNVDVSSDVLLFDICDKLIKDNDGKMLICGRKDDVYTYDYEFVSDELSALKLLEA